MYEDIENLLATNVNRVRNLVTVYDQYVRGQGRGRRRVTDTDVLRAAVVLLHATLESFLREVLKYRLPFSNETVINNIPLSGIGPITRAEKFFLGSLVQHKGKSVDQVIKMSVEKYVSTLSFNDTTEIITRLRSVNISYEASPQNLLPSLDELIKRRHRIVHEADRNPTMGSGQHHAQSISQWVVNNWIETVDKFLKEILRLLRQP